MHVVSHQIAGVTIQTQSDVWIPHFERPIFEPFRVDPGIPADMHQWICQYDPQEALLPPLEGDERERLLRTIGFPPRWLDKPVLGSPYVRSRLRLHLDQPESVFVALQWNRVIIRNFARNELELIYPLDRRTEFIDALFWAGYRNLTGDLLPNFSVMLVHSSGIVVNGKAALFLASDEGGKTTVATSAGQRPILSDDHVALRQADQALTVYATPLGQLCSGFYQVPLGGLFILEKASAFHLSLVSRHDMLQYLWNENLNNRPYLAQPLKKKAFDLFWAACSQVPLYRMQFPKAYVDWPAIESAIR